MLDCFVRLRDITLHLTCASVADAYDLLENVEETFIPFHISKAQIHLDLPAAMSELDRNAIRTERDNIVQHLLLPGFERQAIPPSNYTWPLQMRKELCQKAKEIQSNRPHLPVSSSSSRLRR